MFASYLGDGDSREIEVAERSAQREKDHLRDQELEKKKEKSVGGRDTGGSSGRSIKVHSFIGSMIAKDKLQSSTESSSTTLDNTTEFEVSACDSRSDDLRKRVLEFIASCDVTFAHYVCCQPRHRF